LVTADGSRTLRSSAHGQTFKSRLGALTESRSVFLEGSGVAARLAGGEPTRLLEIGFGTGLNFLVTAEAARVAGTKLHYVAVEVDLLPAATLRKSITRQSSSGVLPSESKVTVCQSLVPIAQASSGSA